MSASPNAPAGPYSLRIQGSAPIGGKTVVRDVNLRTAVTPNVAGLAYPPQHVLSQIGLAVTSKPPFTLVARLDQPEFAGACINASADRAVLDGALALAWTAIDVASGPLRTQLAARRAS